MTAFGSNLSDKREISDLIITNIAIEKFRQANVKDYCSGSKS